MQLVKITLIVTITAVIINFVRSGLDFHIAKVLPFCGGYKPSFYAFCAIALVALLFWGLNRLKHQGEQKPYIFDDIEYQQMEEDQPEEEEEVDDYE